MTSGGTIVCLMAFNTGQAFVFSVQLEPAVIVAEFLRFPAQKDVTPFTIIQIVLNKLSVMDITVTVGAIVILPGESLLSSPFTIIPEMAVPA